MPTVDTVLHTVGSALVRLVLTGLGAINVIALAAGIPWAILTDYYVPILIILAISAAFWLAVWLVASLRRGPDPERQSRRRREEMILAARRSHGR